MKRNVLVRLGRWRRPCVGQQWRSFGSGRKERGEGGDDEGGKDERGEEEKEERQEVREMVVVGEEEEAAPLWPASLSVTSSSLPSPFSSSSFSSHIAPSSACAPFPFPPGAPLSDSKPTCVYRHPHRPHLPVGEG
jgi:hypothetical protein